MPAIIVFENGTIREFPDADEAQPRGQGVVLRSADGKEIFASDGPVASVTINGQTIQWPPN